MLETAARGLTHHDVARAIHRSYKDESWENQKTQIEVLVEEADCGSALIIAFRGSTNWHDWKYNLAFWKGSIGHGIPGRVHKGFHDAAESVYKYVLETVRQWVSCSGRTGESPLRRRVIVCGHSQGGSTAEHTAARLRHDPAMADTWKLVGLYCIAQAPANLGDGTFSNWYNIYGPPTFRYVHRADPVPRSPKIGYGVIGRTIILGGGKWDTTGTWFGLRLLWPGRFPFALFGKTIWRGDHCNDFYAALTPKVPL